MDASGDRKSGARKFTAIVVGTDEGIGALTADLGPEPIHMGTLHKGDRQAVMDRAKFDGTEIAGSCIRLEKQRALSKALGHFKHKGKYNYTNRRRLSRTHNALLWQMIPEPLEGFLLQHGCAARDLVFQCDADSRDFANDQGWHRENRGPAHSLAAILAWGNSHGRGPKGTVSLDIADPLARQTLKRFK